MQNRNIDNDTKQRCTKRDGLGCSVVFAIVLIGLVGTTAFVGPRLQGLLGHQTVATILPFEDNTSPEQLAEHRAQAMAQLTEYAWIDQKAGTARIPIKRAMTLLVERGLPVGSETTEQQELPESSVDLTNVNFEVDVLPIFRTHCTECHGNEDPDEDLQLTSYGSVMYGSLNGSVVEPGNPGKSFLVEQIVTGQMPKRRDPLSQAEIDVIVAWVQAGAAKNSGNQK